MTAKQRRKLLDCIASVDLDTPRIHAAPAAQAARSSFGSAATQASASSIATLLALPILVSTSRPSFTSR